MSGFEINLFHQSLSGLIKALRANKRDEQKVINTALTEIRQEVRRKDWDVKAAAVLKLTYLEMLGHPTLIQHSFPVIECMASQKFHIKQIGYLAASQSFGESTDTILLTNNLIKKDLTSSADSSTVILALTSLPTLLISSPQLANDVLPDLLRMLTHSKANVRRIATLTICKIWTSKAYVIPLEFSHVEKLRSGLNDDDASVVSATVNAMLELGRSRRESLNSLLGLAPELFDLLTNSSNNWMLIKIVKLFSLLTPIEPRLVRKLLPPLSNLINTTPAFSLLYECIQTVITGGMLASPLSAEATTLARVCVEKLASFLSDSDQNLRYIALKGLSRLLYSSSAGDSYEVQSLLTPHYEDILVCIDEDDLTIRLKALELVERLTDRANCKMIVNRLLNQIAPTGNAKGKGAKSVESAGRPSAAAALRAISSSYDTSSPSGLASNDTTTAVSASTTALASYKYRLLLLILRLTSRSSDDGSQLYVNITNFEWYIDTLVTVSYLALSVSSSVASSDLASSEQNSIGTKISEALLDVTSRAAAIRDFTVKRMKRLISDESFVEKSLPSSNNPRSAINNLRIVKAAAFIVSEYDDPSLGLENCETLLERIKSASVNNGGLSDGELRLAAMKCLSKWLQSSVADWDENRMSVIAKELAKFRGILESSGTESLYFVQLLELVASRLDGPRYDPPPVDNKEATIEDNIDNEDKDEPSDDPSHNPFASSSSQTPPNAKSEENPATASEVKGAPVALSLLYSIFFAYQLKPLASNAQELVDVPDGLDLDAWVGQPIDETTLRAIEDEGDAATSTSSTKKAEVDEYGRPRVQHASTSASPYGSDSGRKKSKKKTTPSTRISSAGYNDYDEYEVDRQKDEQENGEEDDVDSIPIVKLDLGESSGLDGKRKGKKKSSSNSPATSRKRTPSPPPLILTAGGEAPAMSIKPKPSSASLSSLPLKQTSAMNTPLIGTPRSESMLDRPEVSEAISEQPPVKVVKVKAKRAKSKSAGTTLNSGEGGEGSEVKKVKKKKKVTGVE